MGADSGSDSSDNSFITILSTGAYRIKGQVNEQNRNTVVPGSAVIVRSRVDENQIWHGTMGLWTSRILRTAVAVIPILECPAVMILRVPVPILSM